MSYVVVGFYTPNYAEIAEDFRRNLQDKAIPHHLYSVDRIGETWIGETLRKPSIVLRAMEDHPGKSIILMDVDCSVRGPLEPLLTDADVALRLIHRRQKCSRASSVVVVFHPTEAARRLAENWKRKCDDQIARVRSMRIGRRRIMSRHLAIDDEVLLLDALLSTPDLTIRNIQSDRLSEIVGHNSAHDQFAPPQKMVAAAKAALKAGRRRLVEIIVRQPYEEWKYR